MTLDGDEFLNVRVGGGKVQDLIAACPETDEILVDWRIFGSGNETDLSDELVTKRYQHAGPDDKALNSSCGFKLLFRNDCFKRPGIHRTRVPLIDAPRMVNGSGLREGECDKLQWRSRDPRQSQVFSGQPLCRARRVQLSDQICAEQLLSSGPRGCVKILGPVQYERASG